MNNKHILITILGCISMIGAQTSHAAAALPKGVEKEWEEYRNINVTNGTTKTIYAGLYTKEGNDFKLVGEQEKIDAGKNGSVKRLVKGRSCKGECKEKDAPGDILPQQDKSKQYYLPGKKTIVVFDYEPLKQVLKYDKSMCTVRDDIAGSRECGNIVWGWVPAALLKQHMTVRSFTKTQRAFEGISRKIFVHGAIGQLYGWPEQSQYVFPDIYVIGRDSDGDTYSFYERTPWAREGSAEEHAYRVQATKEGVARE